MTTMRLKDAESEKDLYFNKLNQLDQFLAGALSTEEVQENQAVEAYLREVHKILLNDGGYNSKGQSPNKVGGEEERMDIN